MSIDSPTRLSKGNFLYRHPEFYELMYPETDEATPSMCLRMFSRFLSKPPKSILDVGSGTGRDLDVLSRTCTDCSGIDAVPENIEYAKKIRPHLNLQVEDMRTARLGRTFDVVMCMGSTLMYALTNQDVEKVLQTFVAHAHPGTLLVLDLRNASSLLDGEKFVEREKKDVNLPGLSAKVISLHSIDHYEHLLIRRRTWHIHGQEPVEDFCEYRFFYPTELEHLLGEKGFRIVGMYDNKELKDTDLSGPRLYIAATFDPQNTSTNTA